MKYAMLGILVFLVSCKASVGDGDSTFTNAPNNSVDNSVNGISECKKGSSVVCDEEGNTWTITQECRAPSGDPVIVEGPNFFTEQPASCVFEADAETDIDGDGDVEAVSTIDSGFSFDD